MPLIVFQHSPGGTAGRLGVVLRDRGYKLNVIHSAAGESIPPDLDEVEGVICLGGPMNVDQADQHPWMARELEYLREAHEREIPVVGICLGAQMIAAALGGEVGVMDVPQVGWDAVKSEFPGTIDSILAGIPWTMQQCHFHWQEVKTLPGGATLLASSKLCKVQAYKVGQTTYAFQYHFEMLQPKIEAGIQKHAEAIRQAGRDPDAMAQLTVKNYPMYDQLSTRLSDNLAMLLFPSRKYVWARPGEPVANFQPERS